MEKSTMSVQELSRQMGISLPMAYALVKEPGFPTLRIRYRLTSSEVNTTYLLQVLKTDSMRKKMAGRGANIQNLNQQILATLDIPLPPIEQQRQFAAFVEQTDKSKLYGEMEVAA